MRSKCLLLLSLSLAPPAVAAQTNNAPSLESVLTLRVDGNIEIDAHGRVASHKLDTPLPEEYVALIDKAIAGWKFKPPTDGGKPVDRARSRMRIALAAHEVGEHFVMKVDNVTFPFDGPTPGRIWKVKGRDPKFDGNAEALLTLKVKVDATGRMLNVSPSQCAVFALHRHDSAEQVCRTLERNSVAALRASKFEVTPGTDPEQEFFTGTAALHFVADHKAPEKHDVFGQWRRELRTPYREAPWLKADAPRVGTADVSGSGLVQQQAGLTLLEGIGRTL
jgi:hypothetical protein